jgi:UDP-N-acetylglucosamine 2-epimerase
LQAQIHRAFDHPDFAACRQRIGLCQALAYPDMVWAMQHCKAIITDSGGLQEEASAFSKPVLVLRDSTERPEAIAAGYAQLIGSQSAGLLTALQDLQNTNWAAALNAADGLQRWPFGDGQASERIAQCLMRHSNPIKATRPHAEQLQKADQHQHEQP